MGKIFFCRELGGVCDEVFSGETLNEIMQKGMEHMQSDDAHKEHVAGMADRRGENRDQWLERMQKEFDAKPDNA